MKKFHFLFLEFFSTFPAKNKSKATFQLLEKFSTLLERTKIYNSKAS